MCLVRTVEIEVSETELIKSLVELSLDEVRLVRDVAELGCDEELFTGDDRRDNFLEGATDLFLVSVNPGEVQVAISISDGDLDLFGSIRVDHW